MRPLGKGRHDGKPRAHHAMPKRDERIQAEFTHGRQIVVCCYSSTIVFVVVYFLVAFTINLTILNKHD